MADQVNTYAGDIAVDETMRILAQEAASILIDVRTEPEWQYVGAPDLSGIGKEVVYLPWQIYPSMQVMPDFAQQLGEIPASAGRGSGCAAVVPLPFRRAVTFGRNRDDQGGMEPMLQHFRRLRRPAGPQPKAGPDRRLEG